MATVVEPSSSIFGRIVTGDDLERWVTETLRKWSSTYIAEVERQHGIPAGTLARPRSWVTANAIEKWPEDQLPAVIVVSVGLAENPLRNGDRFRARWEIHIACVCSARREDEAHRMAMLYLAAHRSILVQRPSLEGRARGVDWVDEDYEPIDFDDSRTLAGGEAVFWIEVDDVVSTNSGPTTPDDPLEPDTEPWPEWPVVESTHVTVDAIELPDPLPDH